jgi:hypothetical protein
MNWAQLFFASVLVSFANFALANEECVPFNPEDTRIVDRGPVKSVAGPLAKFNPCHASVKLDTPTFLPRSAAINLRW